MYCLTPSGLDKLKMERGALLDIRATKSREDEDEIVEINRRLSEIQSVLQNCELLSTPPEDERQREQLGATVVVGRGGKDSEYTIVGTIEADAASKRISDESPVGRALLGRTIGECVEVQGGSSYTVKSVRYEL